MKPPMKPPMKPIRPPTAIDGKGHVMRLLSDCEQDISDYDRLVCAGMSPDDVHDSSEFAEMTRDGRLVSWWLVHGQEAVGWCAIHPWHGKYAPGAWHLYGSWVREDFRLRGLAGDMWRFRISGVPDGVPVSVSIQPGKEGSETLARKLGFTLVSHDAPWNEYVLQR